MSQDSLDAQARLLEKLRARKRAAAGKPAAADPLTPRSDTIPAADRSQPLPLSFGQERLWLLDRLAPGGNAFHMAFPLHIRGRLDVDALRRAVRDLVARHEMLRTTFYEIDGTPRQRVLDMADDPPAAELRTVDLTPLDPAEREARVDALRVADGVEPFDLATGPLYRATLIILDDERYELLQTMHHIISDGWSTGLIFRDLGRLLDAHSRGVEPDLPPITVQVVDVAAHQRRQLTGDTLDRLVRYWREALDGAPQTLDLPLDRPRPAVSSHRGGAVERTIGSALANELAALARSERTSLFTVLLGAFDLLIARLSGQSDVLVGSPVAGRQTLATEPLVGFFLNTLILRARIDPATSFRDLLRAVRSQVVSATEHQDVPFEKLLDELQPERQMSVTPFFQVLFNMANLPDVSLSLPGVTVELVDLVPSESKFDLTAYVFEGDLNNKGDALRLAWIYDSELFDRARIESMLDQYLGLLRQLVAAPDQPVGALDLLTDDGRRILPDPTRPLTAPWRESVPGAVARWATEQPERVALVDSRTGVSTTYAELHRRARRIARRLAANGIRRGDVVAIWAHRSTPLVEALIGLLDAGAAFTIFDPHYPIGRLLDYAELAAPRGVIALDEAGPLPDALADALADTCRDEDGDRRLTLGPPGTSLDADPDLDDAWTGVALGADDLAYVAFTSGSTGKPKAVLGRHGPLLHLVPSFAADFGLGEDDRHALLSALSHDPLHRDVFHPLGFGATLAVPDPERIGAPGYLVDWLADERVTVANLVPAMLKMLCSSASAGAELPDLRHVFTVGEVLTRADVDALYALAPSAVCVNLYGSTETQRAVGHVVVPRDADLDPSRPGGTGGLAKAALPLGRGVDATQLLVLGPDDRLAGIGEPGEIAVRSPLLARGYTDPEATRERFTTNPFTDDPNDRIYRTGDLGRYLPNGDVEFVGRADSQVKVRGFRIELQEIEVALAALDGVRDHAVVVRHDDTASGADAGPYLAAYVVLDADPDGAADDTPDGRQVVDPRAWREALTERLPDYMIPATFTVLDALPKTGTGKLDRKALPTPDRGQTSTEYRAPSTPEEQLFAGHWRAVLGVERVGLDDHFFELGGHSLLATRLLARLRDALGVDVPLRTVFDHPRLVDFVAAVLAARRDGMVSPPLVAVPRDGSPLPTSFSQQRLWFLDRLEPGSVAYVLAGGVRLLGPLDVAAFDAAVVALVRRHEALRTRLVTLDGQPWQTILPADDVTAAPLVQVEDLRSADDPLAEALRQAHELSSQPFALDTWPLVRFRLLRLAEEEHALLVAIHHVIADGWSLGVLFSDLTHLYATGSDDELAPLPIQFADVATWERETLEGAVLDAQLDFWRRHLDGAPPALELPTDRPRPTTQTFRGERRLIDLGTERSDTIRQFAQRRGATPFMVLFAAWSYGLGRHAGQDDVVLGMPIAHRQQSEVEAVIGFFANTLALRVDLAGDPSFDVLLDRVRRVALDAFAHQDLPFEKLVAELDTERSLAHSPIFQATLSLQTAEPFTGRFGDLRVADLDVEIRRSAYDIQLSLNDSGTSRAIHGFLDFNPDLFETDTIDRLVERFLVLLDRALELPDAPLSTTDLRADADRRLEAALIDRRPFRSELTARQLFEASVDRYGDRPALTVDDGAWTYTELEARANRLAHLLIERGVGPGQVVALLLERSAELIVALLAVAKADAAYVCLDPAYPEDRLRHMVEDSEAALLVAHGDSFDALPTRVARLDLDDEATHAELEAASTDRPPQRGVAGATAYLIYTSGSTGLPKASVISSRALARLVDCPLTADLGPDDVVSQTASPAFDAAAWEIWAPLTRGARLVLITRDELIEPERLVQRSRREGVTVSFFTTALLHQLAEQRPAVFAGLRTVLFGGERCEPTWVRAVRESFTGRLLHLYGPSECTTYATTYEVETVAENATSVPIGGPIGNTELRVVDAHGQPCPIGVPGELWVGGEGLSDGYLGRPRLTAERFVPDPFSDEPGSRLYRTGDLVRLLPSGALDFLGRIDRQIKLRGYRIEIGEIEAALVAQPAIAQALVTLSDGATPRLIAYVTPSAAERPAAEQLDAESVRARLAERLPAFMMPSAILVLDVFPLTANGKIDQRSLPAPELGSSTEHRPPETDVERTIATLWADILGLDDTPGLDDDFFALGGHSLLAVKVLTRLADALAVEVPVRVLFDQSRLIDFAAAVSALDAGATPTVPPLVRGDFDVEAPTSFSQQRLWFIDQMSPGETAYHIRIGLRLRGALDTDALGRALDDLAERHEALRTTLVARDAEPMQHIAPATGAGLEIEAIDGADDTMLARRVADLADRPFDLATGPLVRAALLQLAEDDHVFLWVFHHAITDGESSRVLLAELDHLYRAHAAGRAPELPPLPIRFVDFAAWERGWLEGDALEHQLDFWRRHLADAPQRLTLTTDRPRPPIQTFVGDIVEFDAPAATADAWRALANARNATPFMVGLAAWSLVLGRHAGQDRVVVGTPIAHRSRAEFEGVVGFFANTLALATDLGGDPSFTELVDRVRSVALDAFAHQDLPFEKLVAELEPDRDPSTPPITQVTFSLHAEDPRIQPLGDLDVTALAADTAQAKYDLHLDLLVSDDRVEGAVTFNVDLFDRSTIERLCDRFVQLLGAVLEAPDQRLSAHDVRDARDREIGASLVDHQPFRDTLTARELFEVSADRYGERPAVSYSDATLRYAELEAEANRLAHLLIDRGVGPGSIVGLLFDRSAALITAMLAVVKADAAYVCLDPAYPADRLTYTITDADIAMLVGTADHLADLPIDGTVDRLATDDDATRAALAHHSDQRPPQRGVAGSTAYLIYTSGSTGQPKASVISSRALARLVDCPFTADLGPDDVVSQSASPAFDAAAWEIWATLAHGAHLVGLDADTLMDPRRLDARLNEAGVTVTFLTTALLHQVAEQRPSVLTGRRAVLFGGERCEPRWIRAARDAFDGRLLHLYGPSECTTYATWFEIDAVADDAVSVPIGGPIANTAIYVVDAQGAPCPIGVPGELWLGGEGLSDGYLGRPALTAEKFVPHPDPAEPGDRLYRTGDLVRVLPSGALDFLGRIDRQIKLRGYRIELGEVEAALAAHPAVGQAHLRLHDDGEPRLVAWVTPAVDGPETEASSETLRDDLRRQLPAFMVPSAILVLDTLPLTANGKIDQRALPLPTPRQTAHRPPTTPVESLIGELWQTTLKLDHVPGLDDDFFALGGHSLLAVRFVSRLEAAAGLAIPVRLVFDQPCLEALADVVQERLEATVEGRETLELLEAMEAMLDADDESSSSDGG